MKSRGAGSSKLSGKVLVRLSAAGSMNSMAVKMIIELSLTLYAETPPLAEKRIRTGKQQPLK